jgi:hypothetical protein
MKGSSTINHKKDANMVSAQEELVQNISDERSKMKEMRS